VDFRKIKMGILAEGKLHNFADPLSLLKFDYLSFWARLRYGLFGAYVFWLMNPNRIPDEMNAREWLGKTAGEEVTNKLFYDLYARNKFGIPLEQISAKQFAHRLKAKEAIGKFGYPEEGLHELILRMERYLAGRGVNIMKGIRVDEVKEGMVSAGGKKINFDIVINTLPTPVLLEIAKGIPENYRKKLSGVKYCPAVCVVYESEDFLSEHYWLNVLMEDIHMIIQHSALFDRYDKKIGWVLKYADSGKDFKLSDAEIKEKYLGVVKNYFPNSVMKGIKVMREEYAEPIYDKNYNENKPDYETPLKWLYNAGISVTYPEIRNMNTALKSGLKIAKIIKSRVSSGHK
jgi:protoporphyrinogen oxidase